MSELNENVFNHEAVGNNDVNLATSTFYKNWYKGELRSVKDVDKIRGDLSIQTLSRSKAQGINVSLVDGGSSLEFIDAIASIGIHAHPQVEPGLSGSRRQAYKLANESGAGIIFTTEPEKVDLIKNIDALTKPIRDNEADIVIPSRDAEAFKTYPPEQARFEIKANNLANSILRSRGLISEDSPDIDFWVGARLFKNEPEILKIFTQKYDLKKMGIKIDNILNMEQWQNAIMIPIIFALSKGLRVKSLSVAYNHPSIQTQSEFGDTTFDRKRVVQFRSIIYGIIEAVRMVEIENGTSSRKSKLVAINN